ncbi:protein SSUH2 homolog isoform X2 [Polypterus senegalus]|uniref:protein SSUH2 homolog isoform X2 n=1 Tax=Polypterus senegalus TaxID=55291 RepID=UPI0019648FBE|nr:protein SSUH2 homolog isoform X2 [Polypterus senegalus]
MENSKPLGSVGLDTQPSAPEAPSAEPSRPFSIYETFLTEEGILPQSPPEDKSLQEITPNGTNSPIISLPTIDDDCAREALIQFATQKCCYGATPAKNLVLMEIKPYATFKYRLETFTEDRGVKWVNEPFHGQDVDGPERGPAPSAWEIAVEGPPLFVDCIVDVPVPHTAYVKVCSTCSGLCTVICYVCGGLGRRTCISCGGTGRQMNNTFCYSCSGMGRSRKNNITEYIQDRQTGFPLKKFSKVNGDNIFCDQSVMVYPIVGFPEEDISEASRVTTQKHLEMFSSTMRIHQQRQTIERIPLYHVIYDWKGKQHSYYIYGTEKKVYAPGYPARCCWLCSIL